MVNVPSGTRFIGISQQVDLTERKSGISNAATQPYTIEELMVPTQGLVSAIGTDITTTSVLLYNVNLISADASNYAVRLPEPNVGGVVGVVNTSSVIVYVFPYNVESSIIGLEDGQGYAVPADGQLYSFTCVKNPVIGVWSVAIPSSNNSITRSVSVSLSADGTYVSGNESRSASALLGTGVSTYTLSSGPVYVLDAPAAGVDYFSTPEFSTYNYVKINSFIVRSNVRAGDLSNNPSQVTSTLMGLTPAQVNEMWGYIKMSYNDGPSAFIVNLYNGARYSEYYSLDTYSGTSTGYVSHYMKPDGLLYQQIEVKSPSNPWMATKSSTGSSAIYISPYLGYGGNSAPESGDPGGFVFSGDIIIEFDFKM